MYKQVRTIDRHVVRIKQISALNFEVTIDDGQPTYFQPHRPDTFFNVIEKAIKSSSLQMSFEGITNE